MSQNNSNDKNISMEQIKKLHAVSGFNPELFVEEYTNPDTGITRKKLPVMVQVAWCKMVYPESKFAITVSPIKDGFAATARVYVNYKDPIDCYISEATVARSYRADKPEISPREWAQTAALGRALRLAGFTVEFSMDSDEMEQIPNDELSFGENKSDTNDGVANVFNGADANIANPTNSETGPAEYEVVEPASHVLTFEEQYNKALKVMCPISKFKDRTLYEVLMLDQDAIEWLAKKYTGSEEVKEAAKIILQHSQKQQSAQ